jgi:hypothetical protein
VVTRAISVSFKHASAIAAVWLIIIFPATAIHAQTLCFSDEQLKSLVIHGYLVLTGNIAGVCAGRYPEMLTPAHIATEHLQTTYRSEVATVEQLALEAYEQHFPGQGRELLDKKTELDNAPLIQAAQKWTLDECKVFLAALDINATKGDWSVLTAGPLTTVYPRARSRFPTCQ